MALTRFVFHCILALFLESSSAQDKWWQNPRPDPSVCCRCVPFFVCKNGAIDITQMSAVPPRTDPTNAVNIEFCPHPVDFCCLVPNLPRHCEAFRPGPEIPTVDKTPQPHKTCECTPWDTCPVHLVVADGKGKTSKELLNMGLVSHSKCTDPWQVCCGIEVPVPGPQSPDHGVHSGHGGSKPPCECVPRELCLPDGTANVFGSGIITPRLPNETGNDKFEGPVKCENPKEVCCQVPVHVSGAHAISGHVTIAATFLTVLCLMR